jgi:ATP:ADP antiporter, AAA family
MPSSPTASTSDPRTLVTHPELGSRQSIPVFRTVDEGAKSWLDRLLSVFADVRAGEGVGALLLTLNVFLLLGAYNLLKPARDGLILAEKNGAVAASYSAAAQAVLLMAVVPFYGWLASRIVRIRLMTFTALFFTANLVVFYVLGHAGVHEGVAFYVWIGIFNVFAVSQIWAFANDIYTEGQGRRLFALIGVGASLGALVGAAVVAPLVRRFQFTPFTLMLVSCAILLVALVITHVVNRRETARADPAAAKTDATPLGRQGGFELILKDRYLLWIAVLTVLLNVVNTTGGFLLNKLVAAQAIQLFGPDDAQIAARSQFITSFSGSVIATVNLVSFVVQLVLTSRVLRYVGIRGSLFILPAIALINYSIIAVVPILAVVRVGKILENATDYSIQNTLRQALYLPTTREAKYKAKAAIDTFFTRAGDVFSAGVVGLGASLGAGVPVFAWLNVALTVAWLGVAGQIAREHRRKTV